MGGFAKLELDWWHQMVLAVQGADSPHSNEKEEHMDYKTVNEGDIIRLKNGQVVTIEDINPNPEWDADEEVWAEGSDRNGSYNVEVYPEDVTDAELVMTAADAANRSLPKAEALLKALELNSFSEFQHIETEYGQHESYFTVGTNDGLTVQFTVTVSNVHLTDF